MNQMIEERITTLQSMDHVIMMMQHEMAYETWILRVPDEADYDDFLDIASDDLSWHLAQRAFTAIIRDYGKHGW
ncbi:MAG: hypothetical protein IJ111_01325 [Eggerthellaceae bacterium]|nr:hypothetical protein [Eggerthellaceae bacterium]